MRRLRVHQVGSNRYVRKRKLIANQVAPAYEVMIEKLRERVEPRVGFTELGGVRIALSLDSLE